MTYEERLKKYQNIIQAQDLVREVICRGEGETEKALREIDKALSVALNFLNKQYSIGMISGKSQPYKFKDEKKDSIEIVWHIDDIKQQNESLTDDQARKILKNLEEKHDCNFGITWETIDYEIERYLHENE